VNNDDIKAIVLREIGNIAPEIDPAQIDPAINFRQQVDLDSIDILNLMIAINTATGIEIPEADYPKIDTVDKCIAYIASHIRPA